VRVYVVDNGKDRKEFTSMTQICRYLGYRSNASVYRAIEAQKILNGGYKITFYESSNDTFVNNDKAIMPYSDVYKFLCEHTPSRPIDLMLEFNINYDKYIQVISYMTFKYPIWEDFDCNGKVVIGVM